MPKRDDALFGGTLHKPMEYHLPPQSWPILNVGSKWKEEQLSCNQCQHLWLINCSKCIVDAETSGFACRLIEYFHKKWQPQHYEFHLLTEVAVEKSDIIQMRSDGIRLRNVISRFSVCQHVIPVNIGLASMDNDVLTNNQAPSMHRTSIHIAVMNGAEKTSFHFNPSRKSLDSYVLIGDGKRHCNKMHKPSIRMRISRAAWCSSNDKVTSALFVASV